jgi:uncharacterized protein (DUF433 family)
MTDLLQRIVIDPNVMLGKPVVRGTRITVEHIMRELGGGATPADIVDMHPHLSLEDVQGACIYAATRLAEERMLFVAE